MSRRRFWTVSRLIWQGQSDTSLGARGWEKAVTGGVGRVVSVINAIVLSDLSPCEDV